MYKKKVLALLLAALLVISLVPAIALAAYTPPKEIADLSQQGGGEWPLPAGSYYPWLDTQDIQKGTQVYALDTLNAQYAVESTVEIKSLTGYTKGKDAKSLAAGEWVTITDGTYTYLLVMPAADKPAATEAPAEEPAAPVEEPAAPVEEPAAPAAAAATTGTATPTNNKLFLGDKEIPIVAAYKIAGENYFKLRDIAAIVDTADIEYDKTTKVITIVLGKAYTIDPANPTSTAAPTESATYNLSKNTIEIQYVSGDPVPADLTAYKIAGSNYFRLKDLQEIFAFTAEYNDADKSVVITLNNDGSDDDAAGADVPPETPAEPAVTEAPKAAEKSAKEILDAMKAGDDLPASIKVEGKDIKISWYNAGAAYSGKLADGVYGMIAEEGIGAKIGLEMGVTTDYVSWTPAKGWCDASTAFAGFMVEGAKSCIIWHG